MQQQSNREDAYPFSRMYCSKCSNQPMDRQVIGNRLVWACEHNVVYGPTLSHAQRQALKENVA